MKTITRWGVLGMALASACAAFAQDNKPPVTPAAKPAAQATPAAKPAAAQAAPAMNKEQKAQMEAFERMGAVRAEHKQLAYFAGEWKATTTMWMDPKAPPEKTEGKTHAEAIYGGRYIQMKHQGSFGGQPFNGEGFMGFDNLKGKFFNTWIDSTSTGFWLAWGTYDPATKSYTFHGSMENPMKPATQIAVREVIRTTDPSHYTFEWYETRAGGKEAKTLQIDYVKD